jgi:hypothetical protein
MFRGHFKFFAREKTGNLSKKSNTQKGFFLKYVTFVTFVKFAKSFAKTSLVCTWRLSPVLTDAPPLSSSCNPDSCNIKKRFVKTGLLYKDGTDDKRERETRGKEQFKKAVTKERIQY